MYVFSLSLVLKMVNYQTVHVDSENKPIGLFIDLADITLNTNHGRMINISVIFFQHGTCTFM